MEGIYPGGHPGSLALRALTPDSAWSHCPSPQAWHHPTLAGPFVFLLLSEV